MGCKKPLLALKPTVTSIRYSPGSSAVSHYQHVPNILQQYSRNLPRSPFWSQVQVPTPSDGIEVLLSNGGPDQCGPKAGSIEDCSGDNRISALGCGYMAEIG